MNRIVVLAGSPRKNGNTDLMVASFTKGASEHSIVEIISVADYDVSPCIGCNTCFDRENNQCFQNDDMTEIYSKLNDADMLVIASPVYFYGISAQLKAIIDRLHTPVRNRFKIKKLGLMLVGAASLPEMFDSIIVQYRLALSYFKLEDAGMVLVRGAKDKGDITQESLKEAFEMGRMAGY